MSAAPPRATSIALGRGRFAWRSLYEQINSFASGISLRRNPTNRLGLNPSSPFSTVATPLHRPTRFSFWSTPRAPKAYNNNVRRSFASGGLLLVGFTPTSPATTTVVSTCADSAIAGSTTQAANISKLARQAWQRNVHTARTVRGRARTFRNPRRTKTSKTSDDAAKVASSPKKKPDTPQQSRDAPVKPDATPAPKPGGQHPEPASMSKYFHLSMPHLPHLPHRPTKEEFLAAANGFWQRLRVRFKWFSIRSMRPWNVDEWGAFVSWFLFGHLVWVLVGTTTFFSLIILFINTVFAQGRSHPDTLKSCGPRLTTRLPRNTCEMGW